MKHVKRILIVLIILFIGICVINAKTDFLLNIGSYIPYLHEKHPEIEKGISQFAEGLADITDRIPSVSEIIAIIRHEELPIDPSDVAHNAYIENSPMITFYPDENIGIITDFSTVQIFGAATSKDKSHLVVNFVTEDGETLGQTSTEVNSERRFNKIIDIPDTDSYTLKVNVYTGSREFGQFESWVYNYVTITRTPDGGWIFEPSPVYSSNKKLYEKDKSISEALKSTSSIQSGHENIKSIAEQVTEGKESDYDKALALHDWVCNYLYYDVDSVNTDDIPPYKAEEVLSSKKAVCRGYANLMAALCRSVGLPCNVVTGYALGVGSDTEWTDDTVATSEQNHAWNEVYVDGRWVIVDTTWDSKNKYENGEMLRDENISHIYFDANLQFFSENHKIIEYQKR